MRPSKLLGLETGMPGLSGNENKIYQWNALTSVRTMLVVVMVWHGMVTSLCWMDEVPGRSVVTGL